MPRSRESHKIGPYEILREIGRGGMATVYEAKLPSEEAHVALKVADSDKSDFIKAEEEHLEELAAVLQHPSILNILPLHLGDGEKPHYIARDPKSGRWYIALRYVSGGSLRDRLDSSGRIGLREAIKIASQIAYALDYAHSKGIIHQDVKPTNILLEETSSGETRTFLSDFGIATSKCLKDTGMIVGTAGYMSPEQTLGEKLDRRSDVYSLGVVLHEMLTGRLPSENSPNTVASEHANQPLSSRSDLLPQEVEPIVVRALAKDPDKRFQSIGDMAAALANALRASDAARADCPPSLRSTADSQKYLPRNEH